MALPEVGCSIWHSLLRRPQKQANPHVTKEEIKQQIHSHIKSFPTIEGHYGRGTSSKGKKYLSSCLSVAAMHELYLEMYEPEEYAKMQTDGSCNPQVKYDYYREYFNTHFNLSFGVPRTDTCATCDEKDSRVTNKPTYILPRVLHCITYVYRHGKGK